MQWRAECIADLEANGIGRLFHRPSGMDATLIRARAQRQGQDVGCNAGRPACISQQWFGVVQSCLQRRESKIRTYNTRPPKTREETRVEEVLSHVHQSAVDYLPAGWPMVTAVRLKLGSETSLSMYAATSALAIPVASRLSSRAVTIFHDPFGISDGVKPVGRTSR